MTIPECHRRNRHPDPYGLRLLAGFVLLIVGGVLAIPGIPGPGIPIVLLGLFLLSDRYAWAGKVLAWIGKRTAGLRRTLRRDDAVKSEAVNELLAEKQQSGRS